MRWIRQRCIFSLILLHCQLSLLPAQQVFQEQRVPSGEFAVMAWGPTPPDPQQIQWMKDAGINIAGFAEVKDLAAFERAGVQVFVSDARINGYNFEKPLDPALVRTNVQAVAKEVGSSPSVIGFLLRDEPHAKIVPGLGIVAKQIQETMPGKMIYVNLLPSRASSDLMGVSSYEKYVRLVVDELRQPFISYDNYSLVNGQMDDDFYVNLRKIREFSLGANVAFWNCVLSNAHFDYMENTDATYHLQAYATMAYGGRGIQYFSYFTWPIGNFRMGPIDQFGNKTDSWDMLRRTNNEIHALAPTLKRLKSTGVYHYPGAPPYGKPLIESQFIESVAMAQSHHVPILAECSFLVGEFVDDHGRPYFMLVNKDLKHSFHFDITLRKSGARLIHISPYSGREENSTDEMDWIAPGAGHLFRIE